MKDVNLATKMPWTVKGAGIFAGELLIAATGDEETPNNSGATQAANAALIVRAVNCFGDFRSLAEEYARVVRYYIEIDKNKGDDEGAKLKTFTLNRIAALLTKASAQ